tara:strand:- start:259 stop:1269 length:1011 start_codon:yes stop_codon:yes gene_type:complete
MYDTSGQWSYLPDLQPFDRDFSFEEGELINSGSKTNVRKVVPWGVFQEIRSRSFPSFPKGFPGEDRLAVKYLLPETQNDPDYRAKMALEIIHHAMLQPHQNVVTAHGYYSLGDEHHLVMDYAEGVTVLNLIDAYQLEVDECLYLAMKVAMGLHHAHEHNIIHRDVKPENIIVTPDGTPKIADFGVSLARDEVDFIGCRNTQTLQVVWGTPEYMSPEQAEGGVCGRSSDIYSLGVVLYRMLTGKNPFDAGENMDYDTMRNHRLKYAPSLNRVRDGIPQGVDGVVSSALEKKPIFRHYDCSEFVSSLASVFILAGYHIKETREKLGEKVKLLQESARG